MKNNTYWCEHCGISYDSINATSCKYCNDCHSVIINALSNIPKKVNVKFIPYPYAISEALENRINSAYVRQINHNYYVDGVDYLKIYISNPNDMSELITLYCAEGKEPMVYARFSIETDELLEII